MDETHEEVMHSSSTPESVIQVLEKRIKENQEKIITIKGWCKNCGICAAVCPLKVLKLDAEGFPELSDQEKCSSCGLCELMCPDFAIAVPGFRKKKKK